MEKVSPQRSIQTITLIGPESTGKTTLCEKLASKYNTVYVPEYLRIYSQHKWDTQGKVCEWDDMLPILERQLAEEKKYVFLANRFLFLDTNPITLYVYSQIYFQKVSEEITQACLNRDNNEYYLLTDIDVPWEFDVLRDRPNDRDNIFDLMEQELLKRHLPYTTVSGSVEERLTQIDYILKTL